MKQLMLLVVCLLAGYVLGRWTPTTDLYRLRTELQELRDSRRQTGIGLSPGVAAQSFLRIEAPAPGVDPDLDPEPVVEAGPQPAAETNLATEAESSQPENMEEAVERAKEMWTVRADLARSSFLENLDATEPEQVRFSVLVEAMNMRLAQSIETWADNVRDRGEIRAEDGARLMHEMSGAIVLTYDEMDRGLRESWRETTEPEFALFDFIDPAVADPLVDLEGLEGGFERMGPGRRAR